MPPHGSYLWGLVGRFRFCCLCVQLVTSSLWSWRRWKRTFVTRTQTMTAPTSAWRYWTIEEHNSLFLQSSAFLYSTQGALQLNIIQHFRLFLRFRKLPAVSNMEESHTADVTSQPAVTSPSKKKRKFRSAAAIERSRLLKLSKTQGSLWKAQSKALFYLWPCLQENWSATAQRSVI